jgi:hypothetical protein
LAFVFVHFRSILNDVEKLSSTDVECYWNKNKTEAMSVFEPKPVRSYECVKVAKRCRDLNEEEKNAALLKFKNSRPASILYKHSLGICGGSNKRRRDEGPSQDGIGQEVVQIN